MSVAFVIGIIPFARLRRFYVQPGQHVFIAVQIVNVTFILIQIAFLFGQSQFQRLHLLFELLRVMIKYVVVVMLISRSENSLCERIAFLMADVLIVVIVFLIMAYFVLLQKSNAFALRVGL